MAEYTSLEKIRLCRRSTSCAAEGVEPYPTRAERTHTSAEAIAAFEAGEKAEPEIQVTLAGRIRPVRPMGKLSFAHIEDGAGRVQLLLRANELGQERVDFFNKMFDIGDFIQAAGMMFRTKTGEVTLQVARLQAAGKGREPIAGGQGRNPAGWQRLSGMQRLKIPSCAPASGMPTWP